MSKILSIDTSNYTTSACLFDTEKGVIWENRIMLPVTSGSCGLRQSEAVFLHNKNLLSLFTRIDRSDVDYVAVSSCPSERTDSYMPCFVVGHSFASALSNILGVPLYICSHQKNHIGAALYSGNCLELLEKEFFAYHISGGTTDIVLCSKENGTLKISKVGGTADISCGQLIDRVGVAMKFSFPCGKFLEQNSSGKLTGRIKISNSDFMYNFSGFENKVNDMLTNGATVNQVSDYVLDIVASFILSSIEELRGSYKNIPVLLSGGVMSNKYISSFIQEKVTDVHFAEHEYSVDNAMGTAFMCAYERELLNE